MDFFKSLVWEVLVRAGLTALFRAVPLLGLPIISSIVAWLVLQFAESLYDGAREWIDFQRIAFRNQQLEREFTKAAINLRSIAQNEGLDSPAFKEARDAHRKALSDLVRFGA